MEHRGCNKQTNKQIINPHSIDERDCGVGSRLGLGLGLAFDLSYPSIPSVRPITGLYDSFALCHFKTVSNFPFAISHFQFPTSNIQHPPATSNIQHPINIHGGLSRVLYSVHRPDSRVSECIWREGGIIFISAFSTMQDLIYTITYIHESMDYSSCNLQG